MNRKIFLFAFLTIFCVSFFMISAVYAQNPDTSSKKSILMAVENSDFKDAVVSLVKKGLIEAGCEIKAIPVKELKEEKTEGYDAIVIVNSNWAWSMNRHVRKFLKSTKEEERKKIVVLTTAGDPEWKTKEKGIDAITSASEMDKSDAVAGDIIGKVKNIIEK